MKRLSKYAIKWNLFDSSYFTIPRTKKRIMNLPTSVAPNQDLSQELVQELVQELRELGFDAIKYASYRTSAKLRYIQKKSKLTLIDFWNCLEGIRDNGLNALEPFSLITVPKLESVVTSFYVNLNKRLPTSQQVDVIDCSRYLLSWLLLAYDNENSGRIRVFSVKIALCTLCNGKLVDKLRYIFSQISDSNGHLILPRFSEYLQEVLALPAMVLEDPSFAYTENLAQTIFDFSTNDGTSKISVNGFLQTILNEFGGPPCLMWLPLLHDMASNEDVNHSVHCSICKVNNIQGFRYKCQKCSNFNICQNCFWQGKTADNHHSDHDVKEYSTNGKFGKSFKNSFRKSLRCVPDKGDHKRRLPKYLPERPLNLTHIVPPSPLPIHNGFPVFHDPMDAFSDQKMFAMDMGPRKEGSYPESLNESSDEEHRLIARYSARLASETKYPHNRTGSATSMGFYESTSQSQRELISQLEERNREIMREISRLRAQQELEFDLEEPVIYEELQALRYHKTDLEDKLNNLQDSRKHLMGQLEGLMRLLKIQQYNPSPRSAKSPPMAIYNHPTSSYYHRSAPTTPHHHHSNDFGNSLHGDFRSSFGVSEPDEFGMRYSADEIQDMLQSSEGPPRVLRNDLLLAADSVTNAMSSLVKELNSGSDDDNINNGIMKPIDFPASASTGQQFSLNPPKNPNWKQDFTKRYQNENSNYLGQNNNGKVTNNNGNGNGQFVNVNGGSGDDSVSPEFREDENDLFSKCVIQTLPKNAEYNGEEINPPNNNNKSGGGGTDDDSYIKTEDEESFIKSDESGSIEWNESKNNGKQWNQNNT